MGSVGPDSGAAVFLQLGLSFGIAGITIWNFYFRLFPGSIQGPQVIEFRKHLQQHIGGRLTVIWDGLPAHLSRQFQHYVIDLSRRMTILDEAELTGLSWDTVKDLVKQRLAKDYAHIRLKASGAPIEAVAMDLSQAYAPAVARHLPEALIVFDRFHVRKLRNEKLDDLRRELVREAESEEAKVVIQGTRWLLL